MCLQEKHKVRIVLGVRLGVFVGKSFPPYAFSLPTDWFHGLSDHLTFLFCLTAGHVRLSHLSVGFRTHLKSVQLHSISIQMQRAWSTTKSDNSERRGDWKRGSGKRGSSKNAGVENAGVENAAPDSSSSSSTQGRGGRSVRSPRGPILSAVEGVSSGQTTVWTDLVQPGDRRTAPWSAPVWEGWNSTSDVACYAQNRFGQYIIWHTRNMAEQWETAPANNVIF